MPGPWRPCTTFSHSPSNSISISTEMPGPWRQFSKFRLHDALVDFNLNRDARPLATFYSVLVGNLGHVFQSQPRCQAPGDVYDVCFREPASSISISTEMPGPWRRAKAAISAPSVILFNLNRDPSPFAT